MSETAVDARPFGGLAGLWAFLAAPAGETDIGGFAGAIRFCDIVFDCARPHDFEDVPELPDRLRGAWGRAIERRMGGCAEPGEDDQLALLQAACFGASPPGAPARLARPYVVQTDAPPGRIVVRLRLFGLASQWWREAGDTLADALGGGIAVRRGGQVRTRFAIGTRTVQWGFGNNRSVEGVDAIDLFFRTPVCLLRGGAVIASMQSLPVFMYERLKGLARWQALRLKLPQWRLDQALEGVDIVGSDLNWQAWPRHSATTGPRAMPARGYVGSVRFHGNVAKLALLARPVALTHIGANTAMGYGRIECSVY